MLHSSLLVMNGPSFTEYAIFMALFLASNGSKYSEHIIGKTFYTQFLDHKAPLAGRPKAAL